ncbi:MAG TPA: hypothetical protein VF688_01860 [Allosphingosinicella sp.]|jgi:hypothetical protein
MRPFTPRQLRENARFLEALSRTGNARLACHVLGLNRSTYFKRRARSPAFAAAWEEAVEAADVSLLDEEHKPRSSRAKSRGAPSDSEQSPFDFAQDERTPERKPTRTRGGEPHLVRLKSGRLQLRRALPGRMTPAAARAFFVALAATANVRRAAAEAGFAHSSFYAKRAQPDFAAQMDAALDLGAFRLEWAAIEAALRSAARPNDPAPPEWQEDAASAPLPAMTPDQMLQLLAYRHRARTHGRAGGPPPKEADPEAVTAKILRKTEAIKRARAAKASAADAKRRKG